MGLFGNRNTDDYVSPFDVDEAPDYVDPSTVVERESQIDARQHQREERRRKAQKRAEHRKQEHIEQAYYHTGQPPASHQRPNIPPSQPAGAARPTTNPVVNAANRPKPQTKRPLAAKLGVAILLLVIATILGNTFSALLVLGAVIILLQSIRLPKPGASNGAGRPTPTASRTPSAASSRTTSSRRTVTVAITVAVVVAIIVAASVIGVIMAQHNTSSGSLRGSFSWSPDDEDDHDYTEPEPETFERTGTLADDYDDERMSFTITRAYAGIHDDLDARTVVIELEASNEGSVATSLSSMGDLEVFQNGVGLRDIYLYIGDDADVLAGYDPSASINEILPDATATITMAYTLRDDTTPLDVRLSDYSGDTTIRSAFEIGEDTPEAPFTQIDSSELPEVPEATDTDGMTTVRDWDDTVIADVQVDDIALGPQTYEGQDTVIVTYRWINRSDDPISLSWLGDIQARLDGTELETAYLSEPPTGYEDGSKYLSVLPGAQATVTIAYELPRTDGTVNARIVDYDDTVLVEGSSELG